MLKELDIIQLNKLSSIIKPSNFKSFLNNKIKQGKLISEIEIFFNDQGILKDFIAKGTVKDLKAEILNNLYLTQTNFNFFADKEDVLVKNIFGQIENINFSDGDMKLNFENGIKINSNFNSKIILKENFLNKYVKYFDKYKFDHKIESLDADLNNNLFIDFDKTYKIKDYNYKISGNIIDSKIELAKSIKNNYITKEIKEIYFSGLQIQTIFKPKKIKLNSEGEYSFDNLNFSKIKLEKNIINDLLKLKLNLDYKDSLELELINYVKAKNSKVSLFFDVEKKRNNTKVNEFYLEEDSNFIKINDLIFKKDKFISFKTIKVNTPNNNFFVQNEKKIVIKGKKFDATKLAKLFSNSNDQNKFEKVNGEIEIDFTKVKVPMSEEIQNFKLLGKIKEGKFTKISSKGDFGNENFLDISLKKEKNGNSKYLEIYSDLTKPLLTEYSFFNGLSGGKLLFTSIIDGTKSNSKLKIENFKVVNAPGVIKLLSLADLGGLADLAEGEGLSFDLLEINMEKKKDFLKLNEILALGPSMSVLMEGYQDKSGLTSLRGTLVPAKTLNKMISKIPVIGNIVIPKEIGEGLFGISFKMKGPKGKIKTTINPIKTITPRFIQKIIEKNKESK